MKTTKLNNNCYVCHFRQFATYGHSRTDAMVKMICLIRGNKARLVVK